MYTIYYIQYNNKLSRHDAKWSVTSSHVFTSISSALTLNHDSRRYELAYI